MNLENSLLMIPGPVPVAPRILRAMSKPMIGHRSKEFGNIYSESRQILSELFQTENDIFIGSVLNSMTYLKNNLNGGS